jgi:GNAT superfamily N-acetyltransferase
MRVFSLLRLMSSSPTVQAKSPAAVGHLTLPLQVGLTYVGLVMTTDDRIPIPAVLDEPTPSSVRVRAIRPTDAPELQRFYAGLSPDSRRMRFLCVSTGLSPAQCASFCTTDHDHREGFVAVVQDGPAAQERIVGHLCLEPVREEAAEVAIAVADEFQHRGVGRRLVFAGLAWARGKYIARLTATMSADNGPIHRLLAGLGRPADVRYAGAGVSTITIHLVAQSIAA